jgi:hypothetical protein
MNDSGRVEAERKIVGEKWDTLLLGGGGEKEHVFVQRFPGNARSSFWKE